MPPNHSDPPEPARPAARGGGRGKAPRRSTDGHPMAYYASSSMADGYWNTAGRGMEDTAYPNQTDPSTRHHCYGGDSPTAHQYKTVDVVGGQQRTAHHRPSYPPRPYPTCSTQTGPTHRGLLQFACVASQFSGHGSTHIKPSKTVTKTRAYGFTGPATDNAGLDYPVPASRQDSSIRRSLISDQDLR